MKKLLWIIILSTSSYVVSSQNLPRVYNQFFMNPYVYNPAYAGVEGHSVIFAMYQDRWSRIENAPSISHINFHIPLKGGLAFGALAYNEKFGPYLESGGKVSTSYLISVDREHFFRFGLSLGAGNTMINYDEFDSPNDSRFTDLIQSESFLIGDVGVAYHFNHFNVGVSLPNLFEHRPLSQTEGLQYDFKPQDNIMFKINYRGHINNRVAIEPHLLYRYNKLTNNQYEAAVILHILHVVWVGGAYRQDDGFIGHLGVKLKEKMAFGYAYGYGNPTYASLTGPSHEIHFGFHINKHDHHGHSSSFIKSHQLSAEERARQAEEERLKKLQALKESRQQQKDEDELSLVAQAKKEEPKEIKHNWNYEKETDPIVRINQYGEEERGIRFDRINEKGEEEVVFSWLPPPPEGSTEETYEIANPAEEPLIRVRPDGTKEAGIKWKRTIDGGEPETLIIWNEIISLEKANQLDHNKAEEVEMGQAKISIRREEPAKEEIVEEEVSEPVESTVEDPKPVVEEKTPVVAENLEDHEEYHENNVRQIAKKGNNMLDLGTGHYVVAGVFEEFWHAEDYSDKLFERGFHDTRVGHLSQTGFYYVVIYNSQNLNQVTKEKNRVKNLSGLSKVWVLTVEE